MEQDWLDGFITHASSGGTPEPATSLSCQGICSWFVWHSDHKTIHLDEWREVLMNNEFLAMDSRVVAFLD
jgi:hypothetical protein